MPPRTERQAKKPKIAPVQQTMVQATIAKIAAIDFTIRPMPENFASGLIDSLKLGLSLRGTEKEEEAYYNLYAQNMEDEVSSPLSKETTPINSSNKQRATDQRIDAVDLDVVNSNNPSEVGEDEEQGEKMVGICKHKDRTKAAGENPAEDITLGDHEGLFFGKDFIEVDGEYIHATQVFGAKWVKRIRDLYAVSPIEHPDNMSLILHDHQLKGAAQMDFLCRSSFRGGILADGMGVGKTLVAICAMFLVKDDPGFSMVVAPKTLCLQWVAAIESAWDEGYGMTAYLLEGPSITAHELLALRVDVVVCSYDQVEASGRAQRALLDQLNAYNNDQHGIVEKPRCPTSALHSSFWRELKLPIKRLVLDEAQLVDKQSSVRHKALKDLFYHSVILLSGTPAHNKWHNFSELIDYLQGHPLKSHDLFLKAFAFDHFGEIDRPDLPRVKLLQRFIQAFTIARPLDILKLKDFIGLV